MREDTEYCKFDVKLQLGRHRRCVARRARWGSFDFSLTARVAQRQPLPCNERLATINLARDREKKKLTSDLRYGFFNAICVFNLSEEQTRLMR